MQAESLVDHDEHFNFEASDIHMRYNSKITANQITIIAGDIHLEGEASFDVTGNFILLTTKYTCTFVKCFAVFI